jgi:hypothetical protein
MDVPPTLEAKGEGYAKAAGGQGGFWAMGAGWNSIFEQATFCLPQAQVPVSNTYQSEYTGVACKRSSR